MKKLHVILLLVFILLLVAFSSFGILKYFNQPQLVLERALKNTAKEYTISYNVKQYETYPSASKSRSSDSVLTVYYSGDKLKTVQTSLTERTRKAYLSNYYFESETTRYGTPGLGKYECHPLNVPEDEKFQPIIGSPVCYYSPAITDPFQEDVFIPPLTRINLLRSYFTNQNLQYLNKKIVAGRECILFLADLQMLPDSASEVIQKIHALQGAQVNKIDLSFCLDEDTNLPLELSIKISLDMPVSDGVGTAYSAGTIFTADYFNEDASTIPFEFPGPFWDTI